ncbi:transmembrane protein 179-like [Liolophura sinensis]|uniref:transmembrane protein 179-like n=1 Tax=Liolophura sinensis TaxID=3198878 RepID=UPI0031590739
MMAVTCGDVYLLAQTVLYIVGSLAGMAAIIPLALAYSELGGRCLLNAEVDWKSSTRTLTYGESSMCTFPMWLFVFGTFVYGAVLAVSHARTLWKIRQNPAIRSEVWVVPFLMINGVVTVLLFIASCIISVGFQKFCSSVVDGAKDAGYEYLVKRCVDFEKLTWTQEGTGWVHDGGKSIVYLTFAQILSWACFLVWLIQTMLSVVRLCRNIKEGTTGNTRTAADMTNIADEEPTA